MRGLSSDEVLDRLWREGLIDAAALERRAIRREVMRRVRSGRDQVSGDGCRRRPFRLLLREGARRNLP